MKLKEMKVFNLLIILNVHHFIIKILKIHSNWLQIYILENLDLILTLACHKMDGALLTKYQDTQKLRYNYINTLYEIYNVD